MSKFLINQYYLEVDKIIKYGGSRKETSIRTPFQNLLNEYCKTKDFILITELEYKTQKGDTVYPDGTVKDVLRLDWGYWESKDEYDDIDEEIKKKIKKGYPTSNILFEDSKTAVLIQGNSEKLRISINKEDDLDRILHSFIEYERPEIRDFRMAIEKFKEDLPTIIDALRSMIYNEGKSNKEFQKVRDGFWKFCQESINPSVTLDDVREMLIQHILTEEIFLSIFSEGHFHRENNVAKEIQKVEETFFIGSVRRNTLFSIENYYLTIKARTSEISNHHEKQKFLKVIYENFYKAYNPKAADRLGIVYTPSEIVHFMIESTDYLLHKHFGKLLVDQGVEILDPATGTGTFITDLIEYLPTNKLEYKYENEIHCNELAILPYYIANLNIEYTYKQKVGEFKEYNNICFVDTLDNVGGLSYKGQTPDMFGFSAENTKRIKEQNKKKISVIIGNPPYNANQINENDNNKNRAYIEVDKRIKDTYVKLSNAKKTKQYDMYKRFYRWASDRVQEGIICFITNRAYIDAKQDDGFRKCIKDEFDECYVIDLGGNIRELSGKDGIFLNEKHTIFGVAAAVGIAITFLVKRNLTQKQDCKIFYIHPCDIRATREEKLQFIIENKFKDIDFTHIQPDKNCNWINLSDNDWDTLVPVADKNTKISKNKKDEKAIFKIYSTGYFTGKDEWIIDFDKQNLILKMDYFIKTYKTVLNQKDENIEYPPNIKWTRNLKTRLARKVSEDLDENLVIRYNSRPFCQHYIYDSKLFIDEHGLLKSVFVGENRVIGFSGTASQKPFQTLANDRFFSYDLLEKTQSLPLYIYDKEGNKQENITDWGLELFNKHYKKSLNKKINREDIFYYVYAVLHNPNYRTKYELNLKREFPRIPFYKNFFQWLNWGKSLMSIHLAWETANPYSLKINGVMEKLAHHSNENDDFEKIQNSPKSQKGTNPKPIEEKFSVTHPKVKLKADKEKGLIYLDEITTLEDIPPEAWEYKLGNRSALEWILDQYREKKPNDPTIAKEFNNYQFSNYKEQVIDLIRRVCTISLETMKIVQDMQKEEE